ncbi:BCD family MFS transporter [Prosthecomicrobium sp. N25]|uniref:BCD family MFS transporter n=1 Tax=Prosthecomicrobium sp. N25 TaxID=3129254 RepID=UPI003077F736
MKRLEATLVGLWTRVGTRFLPFADAATADLPLGRLIRLSLFQVSVGMATVLLVGTLNRVMIVELSVPASIVAIVAALPLVFAPLRALVGFRSDTHRSHLGWRRVPYIWFGTLLQFGGLAIMPFALLVLSGDGEAPAWAGQIGAALAFLLVGAGLQTTQTAGLALATDLAPEASRPRVVALMYVMLLAGMVLSGAVFSAVLATFSELRLIQVIQGAAVVTMALNIAALWKQEARDPARTRHDRETPAFVESFRVFLAEPKAKRFLVAVGLGTAGFAMQDIVLEPYGGEVLHLSVGETSALTAILSVGALAAFAIAARVLGRGFDPCRLAAIGAVAGLPAFAAVALAAPLESPALFRAGTLLIGFGGGFFSVGTLTAAMDLERTGRTGLALGAWGAAQATAAGTAIAAGGFVRDLVAGMAVAGRLGPAVTSPSAGYAAVYQIELVLLFATLVTLGPLARYAAAARPANETPFGLTQLPG